MEALNASNGQEGSDLLEQGGTPESGAGGQGTPGTGNETGDASGGEGNSFPSWHEQLKTNLRGDEALSGLTGVHQLAESYIDLKGKLGSSVSIPGEDAKDDEMASFYQKLGRPESADKYEFQFEEGTPEYLKTAFGADEKEFRELLFNNGMNQKQAANVHDYIQKALVTGDKLGMARMEQARNDGTAALKEDWGESYERNLGVMNLAVQRFANEDLIKAAKASGFANDPNFIKMMYEIGTKISEDSFVDGERPGGDDDDTLRF